MHIFQVGLWEHKTCLTKFCVCVDNFEIKYFSKAGTEHLLESISHNYKYTTDWEGKNYCGLTFDWNCKDDYVDISMPKYIPDRLKQLNHKPKVYPQYSPYEHIRNKVLCQGNTAICHCS